MSNRTSEARDENRVWISEEENGMLIWLGNNELIHKAAGQIFYNPVSAKVENVAIMPQAVVAGSTLTMELYAFDAATKKWGAQIAQVEQMVQTTDCEEWLFFQFNGQHLGPGQWYGFKLICNRGQVALAEGMHHKSGKEPKSMQWTGDTGTEIGSFHNDFHLAYIVELAA